MGSMTFLPKELQGPYKRPCPHFPSCYVRPLPEGELQQPEPLELALAKLTCLQADDMTGLKIKRPYLVDKKW